MLKMRINRTTHSLLLKQMCKEEEDKNNGNRKEQVDGKRKRKSAKETKNYFCEEH